MYKLCMERETPATGSGAAVAAEEGHDPELIPIGAVSPGEKIVRVGQKHGLLVILPIAAALCWLVGAPAATEAVAAWMNKVLWRLK